MRKLPQLSEMEHITSKAFCENMDTILDRVTDEDIAFIIDHKNKSYVLCPAKWFALPGAEHMERMLRNALRYVAAVDDTDLPETMKMVTEFIPMLPQECIEQLITTIQERQQNAQEKEWVELELALKAALPTAEKKE